MTPPLVLLGPQRFSPNLDKAVEDLGVEGPIATITAGWEEREDEDRELRDHLAGRTSNLELVRRGQEIKARDPELHAALRRLRADLLRLRELYHVRLEYGLEAARALFQRPGDDAHLEEERLDAIDSVRRLDEHHLSRVAAVEEEFVHDAGLASHTELGRHREEVASRLQESGALCVAGGHVAVLLEHLALFDVQPIAERPLIAWSAGAMAFSERVVLFHDSPPQGAGNAEVFSSGRGLFPGIVPLPHASERLRLDDPMRIALFARRFGPALCVALDPKSRVDWNGKRWAGRNGTRSLTDTGELVEVPA